MKMRPVPTFAMILLLASLAGRQVCSAADTNAPRSTLPPKRFLLIVETSKAMQKRSDHAYRAVEDLLLSKMDGQLRKGDTLGVWTYNDELHAGQFPLQQWDPETHADISSRILDYLKKQPYEKQPSLMNALAAMQRVVNNSAILTVILISDGAQPMQGTPFDEQINGMFKLWQKEQLKARMPFVTVLRGVKGKLTEYNVTSAPWPVELPDLPPEKVAAAPKPPPKEQKPQPIAAPLIISGKKPQPPPSTPTPGPVVQTADPAIAPSSQPLKLEPSAPTGEPTAAAAQPAPESTAQTSLSANAQLASTAQTFAASAGANPSAISRDQGKPDVSNSEPPNSPTLAATKDVPPSSTAPTVVDSNPKSNAAEPSPPAGQVPATTQKPTADPSSFASTVAVAPQPFLNQRTIIIAALVLAGIVLVLGLITLFRPRQEGSHTSFITRSLDRENKL